MLLDDIGVTEECLLEIVQMALQVAAALASTAVTVICDLSNDLGANRHRYRLGKYLIIKEGRVLAAGLPGSTTLPLVVH